MIAMHERGQLVKLLTAALIPLAASFYGCSAAQVVTGPPKAVFSQLASPFQGLGSRLRGVDPALPGEDVRPEESKKNISMMNPAKAVQVRDKFKPAMEQMAQKVASVFPYVEGYVVATNGDKFFLDFTDKTQVVPGSVLMVFRPGEEYRHPLTGKVLGRFEKKLATAELSEVGPKYSTARLLQKLNGDEARAGDKARITAAKIKLAVMPFENITADGGFDGHFLGELAADSLERTGRFELYDSLKLGRTPGESGPNTNDSALKDALQTLGKNSPDAYLLYGAVREQDGGVVADYKLVSAAAGKIMVADSLAIK